MYKVYATSLLHTTSIIQFDTPTSFLYIFYSVRYFKENINGGECSIGVDECSFVAI